MLNFHSESHLSKSLRYGGSEKAIKTILVTGGAGFIGSHLCERLLNHGHQVICIDNFLTGSYVNIAHLQNNSRFTFFEHDIIEPLNFPVDEIYNLACPASPPHYQADPIFTTKINVLGALNILELGKRYNAKVFQASTSEVYGDPLIHPQPESYNGNVNPIGPRACYDEGKRCAESLFFDYNRVHGLKIKVARIFNTYGPRMQPDDGRVISNFINQALQGDALTVYGQGKQTRSFCYVSDLVEGFVRLMDTDDDVQGPVNLGNPSEFTVRELADLVLEMIASKSKIDYRQLPEDDPKMRQPNVERAHQLLGWKPHVELREGLTETIDYFKSEMTAAAKNGRQASVVMSVGSPVIQLGKVL